MSSIQTEYTTNYLSYLALTKEFLPFLMSKQEESSLILYVAALRSEKRDYI